MPARAEHLARTLAPWQTRYMPRQAEHRLQAAMEEVTPAAMEEVTPLALVEQEQTQAIRRPRNSPFWQTWASIWSRDLTAVTLMDAMVPAQEGSGSSLCIYHQVFAQKIGSFGSWVSPHGAQRTAPGQS